MTNPIIEEAIKRFDKKFVDKNMRAMTLNNEPCIIGKAEDAHAFLSSELQTAISKTRERMVEEIMKEVGEDEDLYSKERKNNNYDWRVQREIGGNEVRYKIRLLLSTLLPTKEKNE